MSHAPSPPQPKPPPLLVGETGMVSMGAPPSERDIVSLLLIKVSFI